MGSPRDGIRDLASYQTAVESYFEAHARLSSMPPLSVQF